MAADTVQRLDLPFSKCIQNITSAVVINVVSRCARQGLTPSQPPHRVPLRAHQRPLLTASRTRRQWRRLYGKAAWPVFTTSCPPSALNWPQPHRTPAPPASVQSFSWPGCASLWVNSALTWSIAFWENRAGPRPQRREHPDRARSWAKPGLQQMSAPPRRHGQAWRRSFSTAVWMRTASGAPPSPKSDTVRNLDVYMWNDICCMWYEVCSVEQISLLHRLRFRIARGNKL